jgi:hypothetical protein
VSWFRACDFFVLRTIPYLTSFATLKIPQSRAGAASSFPLRCCVLSTRRRWLTEFSFQTTSGQTPNAGSGSPAGSAQFAINVAKWLNQRFMKRRFCCLQMIPLSARLAMFSRHIRVLAAPALISPLFWDSAGVFLGCSPVPQQYRTDERDQRGGQGAS